MKYNYVALCFMLLTGCGLGGVLLVPIPGPTGPAGANGHSAMFSEVVADSTTCANGGTVVKMGVDLDDDSILETVEVSQVAILCNGLNGAAASVPEFMPVAVIMPCGSGSSSYKEVLLGLSGGGILSEFTGSASDATTVRNTLVPDGNYYDTDSSQCNFTVSTSGSDRTVSWDGSTHNGSGPFSSGSAVYSASTSSWVVTY